MPGGRGVLADIIRAIRRPILGGRGRHRRPELLEFAGTAEPLKGRLDRRARRPSQGPQNVTLADVVERRLPGLVDELTKDPDAWLAGAARENTAESALR